MSFRTAIKKGMLKAAIAATAMGTVAALATTGIVVHERAPPPGES